MKISNRQPLSPRSGAGKGRRRQSGRIPPGTAAVPIQPSCSAVHAMRAYGTPARALLSHVHSLLYTDSSFQNCRKVQKSGFQARAPLQLVVLALHHSGFHAIAEFAAGAQERADEAPVLLLVHFWPSRSARALLPQKTKQQQTSSTH